MAPRARTWFDDRGLVLGGEAGEQWRLAVYSGALHYWRVAPERWTSALHGLRALGLTTVESYVPWSVHEPAPGDWRWNGARDLRRFVELAGKAELAVILRLGPHANAELTGLGFPADVLRDPEIAARTAHGSPAFLPAPPRSVVVPSYSSSKLHARVARWYQAVAEQLAGLTAPAGPVVAFGVDNEAQLFFRRGAYDLDYHPEAVARWAQEHPQWPEPPRGYHDDDLDRCLAWVAFKEREVARALARFCAALEQAGLGELARVHNVPLGLRGPRAVAAAIGGAVGVDSHGPVHPLALRRKARRAFGGATLPLALECGVGDVPWFPPAGGARGDQARALTLLAAGARAINFYMAVERERWAGGLVEPTGLRLDGADWAASLLAALTELDWPSLRRRPAVALITPDSEERLSEASCLLDPLTPVVSELLGLGPGGHAELAEASSREALAWLAALEGALERAGVSYDVLDEQASLEELARYRAVIAPVARCARAELWRTLHTLVDQHPVTVVLGPWAPERDERGQPWREPALGARDPQRPARRGRVGRLRPGSLQDQDGLVADLAPLAGPAPWRCITPGCVLEVAWDSTDRPRALFLFNDTRAPLHAELVATGEAAPAAALRDPLSGNSYPIVDGRGHVPVAPRGVVLLSIEAAERRPAP